jgi:N-acetylmuramoyl-L-alanine amidase
MKDVIRGGHSLDVRGASGVVDEVTEDRKITAKVIEYLKLDGNEVLDATPSNSGTSIIDLSVPVNKANSWGADYFASIHLNAGGGHGVEVLYKSAKGKEYAERIVNKIAELGFTNRGAKADVRGLYEFNHVIAPNNIIEVFFCDSQSDVDLYNKLGIDVIAKAIAEGIVGHSISGNIVSQPSQPVVEQPKPQPIPKPQSKGNSNVRALQALCNTLGVRDENGNSLDVDGVIGSHTRYAVSHLPLCGIPYTQRIATRYIQTRLHISVDGVFMKQSADAVKSWQLQHGLVADGICGKNTWLSFLNN